MNDPEWTTVGNYMLDLAVYWEDPLAAMWVCSLNLRNKGRGRRFRSSDEARKLVGQLSEQRSDWRAIVLEAQQRLFERKHESKVALDLLEQILDETKAGKRSAELDEEEPNGAPWTLNMVDMPWKAMYDIAIQQNLDEKVRYAVLNGSDIFDDPEAWAIRVEREIDDKFPVNSSEWLNMKSKVATSGNSDSRQSAEAAFEIAMYHLKKEKWYPIQANAKRKVGHDFKGSQAFDWLEVASELFVSAGLRYNVALFAAVLLREWGLISQGKAILDEIKRVLETEYNDNELSKHAVGFLGQWDPNRPNLGSIPSSSAILNAFRRGSQG